MNAEALTAFVAAELGAVANPEKAIPMVMGGPASFSDDALRRAHAKLSISQADMQEMTELLRETLEDFDFEPADVEAVCKEITNRQSLIVTR